MSVRIIGYMKLILAIIKPFKLEEVRLRLLDIGISGMTVSEVSGFGRQRGHSELYKGVEYKIEQIPKAKIEIAVESEIVGEAVRIIRETASTNQIGDGVIFVVKLENIIRIRTGETGKMAFK